MSVVVETSGLAKHYGTVTAVENLDLAVEEGDLFGFLGPNGSGKSTTVRMLLGLVFPSAGRIRVLGHEMPAQGGSALPQIGAIVEEPGFYGHLSGPRNLALIEAARRDDTRTGRRRRIADAISRVGLDGAGRRPVKAYSTGMKQRLAIAAVLLRRPRLVVLDEPTNGLDPQGIHEIRDLLRELVTQGTTVFLSSHLLAEVELVCNRAAIMSEGRLLAQGDVSDLLAPTGRVRVETPDVGAAVELAATIDVAVHDRTPGSVVFGLDSKAPEELNRALVEKGVRVRELVVERRRLEDLFLDLTGHQTADRHAPTQGHRDSAAG
ncbi:MAG TPA: ABC transporter ATP-binding protein [Acidimicrobiales bacterium]|nr:ABC transporter ATP-binding protein [Acidimicrobiales bacterium]